MKRGREREVGREREREREEERELNVYLSSVCNKTVLHFQLSNRLRHFASSGTGPMTGSYKTVLMPTARGRSGECVTISHV